MSYKTPLALLIVVTFLVGADYLAAQWTTPSALPPGNNVAAPVNVSSNSQTKQGLLGVNELIANAVMVGRADTPNNSVLAVDGNIAARAYCDVNGENCFSATSTGQGGGDTITVGGICFEPTLAVTCNWNWSGDGSDNSVYMAPYTAAPSQVCADVDRRYNYHEVVLAKCGSGRYEWSTGSWSTCNAPAREYGTSAGTQTRTVQCIDTINGNAVVSDSYCTVAKPATSQACSIYWGGRGTL